MSRFTDMMTRVRHFLYGEPSVPPASTDVRKVVDDLGKAVEKLDVRVTEIENSADPFQELVRAMRNSKTRDNGRSSRGRMN